MKISDAKPAGSPAESTTQQTDQQATRPRGAARREALLEAVLRIVAEVGPDSVTHRRVAEEAGLPLASTTYWFDSKEDLLTSALELAADRDSARLLAHAAACIDEGRDPLAGAIDAIAEPLAPHDPPGNRSSLTATYALLLEAARRPALREIARRWTEAYILTLGQLLERAGSTRPRDDAELLLAAADGLLIEQLSTGSTTDLHPRLRRVAVALLGTR